MLEPDFRALCEELANALHGYALANPCHESDDLVARARAALGQQTPLEPTFTDEEVEMNSAPWSYLTPAPVTPRFVSEPSPAAQAVFNAADGMEPRKYRGRALAAALRAIADQADYTGERLCVPAHNILTIACELENING